MVAVEVPHEPSECLIVLGGTGGELPVEGLCNRLRPGVGFPFELECFFSLPIQSKIQNGRFTPNEEWPPLYCRPSQVRWCQAMLVFANILPQLEHSPLSALYTLGARGLAPSAASCPPLASLASSLLLAIPARASQVLLCLAMLFLETFLPHVPHLALLGSSALSPMHLFSWFFQLLSEAKVALHLLHVNVFRCFSCILTWWILSSPFDLNIFPHSG